MLRPLSWIIGTIASIAIWLAVLWSVFTYFCPPSRITP